MRDAMMSKRQKRSTRLHIQLNTFSLLTWIDQKNLVDFFYYNQRKSMQSCQNICGHIHFTWTTRTWTMEAITLNKKLQHLIKQWTYFLLHKNNYILYWPFYNQFNLFRNYFVKSCPLISPFSIILCLSYSRWPFSANHSCLSIHLLNIIFISNKVLNNELLKHRYWCLLLLQEQVYFKM